jgi:hypothetical protein
MNANFMPENLGIMANHEDQSGFAQSVHDSAVMHSDSIGNNDASSGVTLFLIREPTSALPSIPQTENHPLRSVGFCTNSYDIGHLILSLGYFRDMIRRG